LKFDSSQRIIHTENDIRDHVFPLARTDGRKFQKIYGTAFMAGLGGYALTAGHCIPDDRTDFSVMFFLDGRWAREPIAAVEKHPTEDVALIKLTSRVNWRCFFRLYPGLRTPPMRYKTWGYPEETYYEEVVDGQMWMRPDLVGGFGEVRRAMPTGTSMLRGAAHYELLSAHGAGMSGSPLVAEERQGAEPRWEVLGIYIGEHTANEKRTFGIAARTERFAEWVPDMLGHSLFEQCNPPIGPAIAA